MTKEKELEYFWCGTGRRRNGVSAPKMQGRFGL